MFPRFMPERMCCSCCTAHLMGHLTAFARAGCVGIGLCVVLAVQAAAQPKFNAVETGELGGESRSGGFEFGILKAVAFDGPRVWVVDEANRRIDLIDTSTGRSYSFGRSGRGPGEFLDVGALSLIEERMIAVLDRGNARLAVIQLSADRLSLVRTIPVRVTNPQAVCSIAGHIVVLGALDGKHLHELDEGGRIVRSFGTPFRSDEPRLERHATRGHLLCSDGRHGPAFVVASEEFGALHAYSSDGALLWRTMLTNFRPIEISFSGNAITYSPPHNQQGSYNIVLSLTSTDSGRTLLAQIGEKSSGTRKNEVTAVTTYVIEAAAGNIEAVSTAYPRIDRVDGSRAMGMENLPVPVIRFYRFQREGGA